MKKEPSNFNQRMKFTDKTAELIEEDFFQPFSRLQIVANTNILNKTAFSKDSVRKKQIFWKRNT